MPSKSDKSSSSKQTSPSAISAKLQRRKERRENRGQEIDAGDWSMANPELVLTLISQATYHGLAITFGVTSKGGVFSVGYYNFETKDRITEYCRPTEDLDEFLTGEILWLKE
jgi:hypothetical protein